MRPNDVSNLRSTIVPKSDQLNAEQLLGGEKVITVTDVRMGNSDEQPVNIHYEDEDGRPYKPCKTMRKLLIFAWGEDGRQWVGKSMRLFNDEQVRFGGMTVGGIRISALSHIEKAITISLTATKGKKAQHTVEVLDVMTLGRVLAKIDAATNKATMAAAKAAAEQLTSSADIDAARQAYAARVAKLKGAAPTATTQAHDLQHYLAKVDEATSAETAQLLLDEAKGVLPPSDQALLADAIDVRFPS